MDRGHPSVLAEETMRRLIDLRDKGYGRERIAELLGLSIASVRTQLTKLNVLERHAAPIPKTPITTRDPTELCVRDLADIGYSVSAISRRLRLPPEQVQTLLRYGRRGAFVFRE